MIRKLIVVAVIFVIAGGLYVSRGTLETVSALFGTARDIFFPDSNEKVVATVNDQPHRAVSGFAAKFSNSLMILDDGVPKSMDTNTLTGVKYWAFYYSASWCQPCRAFTPDLVSFYAEFKPLHPDFELIFVNLDRSQDDMLNYMKSNSMRWPAIWFGDVNNPELEAMKYCSGGGIPCLTLVGADGHVISTNEENGTYRDPHEVIADIKAAVK